MDLFAQDFVSFSDEPVSLPTDNSTTLGNNSSEVDLFADADFVSAEPVPVSGKFPGSQVRLQPVPTCQIYTPTNIQLKQCY